MPDPFVGYRGLACAVLEAAVRDSRARGPRRADAVEFLSGGPALEMWCALAGLDARAVAQQVRRR